MIKNDISLNISNNFETILDHRFDLIKAHFRLFLGFEIFSSSSKLNFCDFLAQNNVIAKATSSKLWFLAQFIFFFGR